MQFLSQKFTTEDKINLLERSILVHSYIYYELNENVLTDYQYDNNCKQLAFLIDNNPEIAHHSRYYLYFKDYQYGETTGFTLISKVREIDPELWWKIQIDGNMAVESKNKGVGGRVGKKKKEPFLYPYQLEAVNKMHNGCILNGGVGSGKSRTGLYYYFKEQGGSIGDEYVPMKRPKDLYIITTAMKRDTLEFESELANFLISTDLHKNSFYGNKVIIDSWNNIKKYAEIKDSFFIFDEDRVTGSGVWVKSFLKIARSNNWIILSATPGDSWEQYIPVFIANGFYKNKTEFTREHLVYASYTRYPKIERYIGTNRLMRLRDRILVDMDYIRHTTPHHEDIFVRFDVTKYRKALQTRWDPYKDEPVQQASGLCYILRRIVNEDESRQKALLELFETRSRMIVFYNFDYELDILKGLYYGNDVEVAEWNGHKHQPVPSCSSWVYLVQYTAGCEGWNCTKTDTIVFYSQNYSYKVLAQAAGRIDRLNTPYSDLYYYHLKTRAGIDLAISRAIRDKKQFNERKFTKW